MPQSKSCKPQPTGLRGPLPDQQRKLSTEDESGVVELITDLRDLFEHLGGHCNEAAAAL